jgi:hypothetical protein
LAERLGRNTGQSIDEVIAGSSLAMLTALYDLAIDARRSNREQG